MGGKARVFHGEIIATISNHRSHGWGEDDVDAWVELRGEDNLPIPGHVLADCDPIDRNAVHHRVSWWGKCDVCQFAGQSVRLRVKMRRAKLYAFQFS